MTMLASSATTLCVPALSPGLLGLSALGVLCGVWSELGWQQRHGVTAQPVEAAALAASQVW